MSSFGPLYTLHSSTLYDTLSFFSLPFDDWAPRELRVSLRDLLDLRFLLTYYLKAQQGA